MKFTVFNIILPGAAIGGISRDNLGDVLAHGAVNFSSVRPITNPTDPYRVIMEFQQLWLTTRSSL